jgi:hypothetical protein
MILELMVPVNNHEQTLYGLRYSLTAWRIGSEYAFHEDRGFFFWDGKTNRQCVAPRFQGEFFLLQVEP